MHHLLRGVGVQLDLILFVLTGLMRNKTLLSTPIPTPATCVGGIPIESTVVQYEEHCALDRLNKIKKTRALKTHKQFHVESKCKINIDIDIAVRLPRFWSSYD